MKAIKYFLYALIATFVFAGCSDDPTYTRGESEADGCYGVYFPSQDNAADLELDPADPTVLTFTAMRTNDADAITVPVTVTGSEDAIFSASEISFDDGATETTFQVSFPDAEIGTTYSCNIQIEDKKYAFIYGEKASGVRLLRHPREMEPRDRAERRDQGQMARRHSQFRLRNSQPLRRRRGGDLRTRRQPRLLPHQQRLLGGVSGFAAEHVSVPSVGQPFGRHYLYRRDESG